MADRILIVDNERTILFAMRAYFTRRGYEVECASGREEAEALLERCEYAVVIADLRLTAPHGAEGLEILATARRLWPDTRFILLTAYGSNELELDARRRGADAFFHKPMSLPEIERQMTELLGRSHRPDPHASPTPVRSS